jgi:hypothetical protein
MAWILAVAIIALLTGWAPSNRLAGILLAMPLASVSLFAWAAGNPFNGTVFAGLALALMWVARFGDGRPASRGERTWRIMGVTMLALGWVYPHFLVERSTLYYAFAAPLGLIPCPTLSAVIGLALLGKGLRNRAWSWTLAGAGIFYAIFGVIRLGVWLDLPLLAGSVALVVVGVGARPQRLQYQPTSAKPT